MSRSPGSIEGVSDTKTIVDKLWNYCNILRDDDPVEAGE